MRIAVLSDIHANREAFETVLEAVRELSPDLVVLLGDIVGYGPDPEFCIEKVAELVDLGALCILGNHDQAVGAGGSGMTSNARAAIDWTRGRLGPAHRSFLAGLPLSAEVEGRLFVHASADGLSDWHYVKDADDASRCLAATDASVVFCGHTHVPAVFYALADRRPVHFRPLDNIAAPLSALRRHVVVVGAVGQPRDGNPAACFALLDTDRAIVTMHRTPYDHGATAAKITAKGLPVWLGMRLKIGR